MPRSVEHIAFAAMPIGPRLPQPSRPHRPFIVKIWKHTPNLSVTMP